MRRITITKPDDEELELLKKRLDIAITVVVILLALLISRLWYLQIHKGAEYAKRSENNRIRNQSIAPPRGAILDRNGQEIVTNKPGFNIVWIKEDAPNPDEVIKRLAQILGDDISDLLGKIRAAADTPRYIPVRIKENIDWRTLVNVENYHYELPGIGIEVVPSRHYLQQDIASHIIGYLGEINPDELKKDIFYQPGDMTGKMGVEKLYEAYLRGQKGFRRLEVDVHGYQQKLIKEDLPSPGNDIFLTIDLDLQKEAENAMVNKSGAVVAMDVQSGRLLVFASIPGLTLENFIGGISTEKWGELNKDPLHPLINKALQAQYPPGSTYKVVTAIAGLAEGVITPEKPFFCGGSYFFGNRSYGCWKKGGHGSISLHNAIAQSCDVYFYQVGQRVGVDTLAKYANSMGLGQLTGVEFENEKPGIIPTAAWKLKKYKVRWQDGETLSIAIGQGFDLVTPLQMCRLMAAVANGGILYRPLMVEKIRGPDGKILAQFTPVVEGKILGSEAQRALVLKALVAAVNEPHGTGGAARLENIMVGGKTGTAQVVHLSKHKDIPYEKIPYQYKDHAWFICFAPAERPEIAVAVLVEHGGHGGGTSAPIAKKVLQKYFDKKNNPNNEPEKGL